MARAVNTERGLAHRIRKLDYSFSRSLAVCADVNTPWLKLRLLSKILEWSFHGAIWLLLTAYFVLVGVNMYETHFPVNLMVALVIDLIVVSVVKVVISRPRPVYNTKDMYMSFKIDEKYSFPSGHTTRAIMCGCLLLYHIDMSFNMQTIIVLWVISTAISRVLLGRHYATDVLAGSSLGFFQFFVMVKHLWISEQQTWDITQYIHSIYSSVNYQPVDPNNL